MGSQLLIHEAPLQVLPSLAVAVGLNEAIILQQLHYWLDKSERRMEGKAWIYNTYTQWQRQFPFWSYNTIRRAMDHLKNLGIIDATTRFNRSPIDKTWWYTINYERLDAFNVPRNVSPTAHSGLSTAQDGRSIAQDGLTTAQVGLTPRDYIQRDPTEIEDPPIVPPSVKGQEHTIEADAKAVMLYLNRATGKHFREPALITPCLRRGATVTECTLVIDWWQHWKIVDDPTQIKYFNTQTPFRPEKFDSYRAIAEAWDLEGRHPPQNTTASRTKQRDIENYDSTLDLEDVINGAKRRTDLRDTPGPTGIGLQRGTPTPQETRVLGGPVRYAP